MRVIRRLRAGEIGGVAFELGVGDGEVTRGLGGDGDGVGHHRVGDAAGQAQRPTLRGAEPVRQIATRHDRAHAGQRRGGGADDVGVEVVRVNDAHVVGADEPRHARDLQRGVRLRQRAAQPDELTGNFRPAVED